MHVNWRASSMHAAIVALCNSVLQLVNALGAHLNGSQDVAITSTINSALVVISVIFISATNGNGAKP